MNALAALLLALNAGVDPCAPVAASAQPDPVGAAAYARVGQAEQEAGSTQTAAEAYRRALELDPGQAQARAGLEALCHPPPTSEELFQRGRARMDRGNCRGAIEDFRAAQAPDPDPGAALLEGICRSQLGDDRAARAALDVARTSPDLADAADFYLGLLALRDGQAPRAARLLEAAAQSKDAQLSGASTLLLGESRRQGRLGLSAYLEPGYDSNVDLGPEGVATPGQNGDAALTAALAVRTEPLGPSGPYAGASGTYRQQLQLTAYDLAALQALAGWAFQRPRYALDAEYAFDGLELGGAPYLFSHRILARGDLSLDHVSLGGSYALRLERYPGAALADYSGPRQVGLLYLGLHLGGGAQLVAGYQGERDGAQLPELSYWEHGPSLSLDLRLAQPVRLVLGADARFRSYDAIDPDLGVVRADQYLDARAVAALDLAAHFTLQAVASARRAFSNVPDFAFTRITAGLGLAYAAGFF